MKSKNILVLFPYHIENTSYECLLTLMVLKKVYNMKNLSLCLQQLSKRRNLERLHKPRNENSQQMTLSVDIVSGKVVTPWELAREAPAASVAQKKWKSTKCFLFHRQYSLYIRYWTRRLPSVFLSEVRSNCLSFCEASSVPVPESNPVVMLLSLAICDFLLDYFGAAICDICTTPSVQASQRLIGWETRHAFARNFTIASNKLWR